MTATAPARTSAWSDGTVRDHRGTDLQFAITSYFGEKAASEAQRLRLENEKLRDLIEARKAKGATA